MRIKIIKLICSIMGYTVKETAINLPMWQVVPKKIKR
jgi:hypothetical protein